MIVAGYFLIFGVIMLLFNASASDVWKAWGVPAMDPHFGDLFNVVAGIENRDAGRAIGDPNPFDPWNRPYIYPSLWLEAKAIGFNRDTIDVFGWLIVLSFFASVLALMGKLSADEGIFTGLFLISPAILTGVERGNIDLVLFPLILAAVALRRHPSAVASLLILVTVLKIHPAGALLVFLAPPWRKTLPWLAGILGVLFLYALTYGKELAVINAHAQHYPFLTFGSAVVGLWLAQMNPSGEPPDFHSLLFWGSVVLLLIGGAVLRFGPRVAPEARWDWELHAFRLGAGLHLALFAVGASNDYGMLFFLFCLPLLFRCWADTGPLRWWAALALTSSLLYVNWNLFSDEYLLRHMLIKQALGWGLAASLIALLNATRSWPTIWLESKSA